MGRERGSEALKGEIVKIKLGELETFCRSEQYRQFSVVPVTPSRAASYIQNPNGSPDDVVLLLYLSGGDLIAFRSLFAGALCLKDEKVRFGWCSGSWVKPEFRRQGLSQLLLKEAHSDWGGRLMLTNYSPETERLFLKTGLFNPIHRFHGARGYLFPKTEKLLPQVKKNKLIKLLCRLTDKVTGFLWIGRLFFHRYQVPENVSFETGVYLDKESMDFIEKSGRDYLFCMGEKELIWIMNYPWISESNRTVKSKYPFSACSESFYYQSVKVRLENELAGILLFSVREGHFKTLFVTGAPQLESAMAGYIKNFAVKGKLEMITVNHEGIANELLAHGQPFLYVKKAGQMIYSSFAVPEAQSCLFHDGEGDYIFT